MTCLNENKSYIGRADKYKITNSGNIKKYDSHCRWKLHISKAKNNVSDCNALNEAIRKYGEDNFILEILYEGDEKLLDALETKYQIEYNTLIPNGYNIRLGGMNGFKKHPSSIRKSKLTQKGKERPNKIKRKNSEDDHLPKGVQKSRDKDKKHIGYRSHRLSKLNKSFTSDKIPMEELLQYAIKFRNAPSDTEASEIYKIYRHKIINLFRTKDTSKNKPFGINSRKHGFRVTCYPLAKFGKKNEYSFTSLMKTNEQLLEEAKIQVIICEYLLKIEELKVKVSLYK